MVESNKYAARLKSRKSSIINTTEILDKNNQLEGNNNIKSLFSLVNKVNIMDNKKSSQTDNNLNYIVAEEDMISLRSEGYPIDNLKPLFGYHVLNKYEFAMTSLCPSVDADISAYNKFIYDKETRK